MTATKGNEFEDYFLKRELLMGIFEKGGALRRGGGAIGHRAHPPAVPHAPSLHARLRRL